MPARPIVDERTSGTGQVTYDAAALRASVETVPIRDPQLRRAWGPEIYRVVMRASNPARTGSWRFTVARA